MNLSKTNGPADASSWSPVISADKRFIAFASFASNYVDGDSNNKFDVFVRGPYGRGPGGSLSEPALLPRGAVKVGKLGKGFVVGFSAPAAGTLTLAGSVPKALARKLRLGGRVVVRGTATVTGAGVVSVKLTATKAGRRLALTRREPTITLAGTFGTTPVSRLGEPEALGAGAHVGAVDVAVADGEEDPLVLGEAPRQLLDDRHGAVPAAGAADRDREMRLALRDVLGQQELEQREDVRVERVEPPVAADVLDDATGRSR